MRGAWTEADFIVSARFSGYQFTRMIKALFLIFEPAAAWDRVVNARRSVGFLLLFYLLPMVLMVSAAEGFSLMKWGRPQWDSGQIKIFTAEETETYEVAQSLAMLAVVFICGQIARAFANASYRRHNFTQGFTVAACGLSPLFLLRLLDVFPAINPWLIWGVGIMLCVATLYNGIPRVMQPDPSQAFGLYFMCAVIFILVTGLERFVTVWYLAGRMPPLKEIISRFTSHL
jgi:Yip1-like protein